jgi:hypothetical protein
LDYLQRLQHHQIRINPSAKPINGISRLSETHNRVFAVNGDLKLIQISSRQRFKVDTRKMLTCAS